MRIGVRQRDEKADFNDVVGREPGRELVGLGVPRNILSHFVRDVLKDKDICMK